MISHMTTIFIYMKLSYVNEQKPPIFRDGRGSCPYLFTIGNAAIIELYLDPAGFFRV